MHKREAPTNISAVQIKQGNSSCKQYESVGGELLANYSFQSENSSALSSHCYCRSSHLNGEIEALVFNFIIFVY